MKMTKENNCIMWSMQNGKVYKKCPQVYELEAKNKQQADFMALAKEEMDSLQADNSLLTKQINIALFSNIRFESMNKKLKKSIIAEKKGHAATAKIVLDVQAENDRLKERQLAQSQTEYLIKFLKLRLMSKPNQAIEEILQTLKEKL